MRAATHTGQIARIREEALHILESALRATPGSASETRLLDEVAWWRDGQPESLHEAVRRSFCTRRVCLDSEDRTSWRKSLSFIGATADDEAAVSTHEYERAYVDLSPTARVSRPYSAWNAECDAARPLYASSGMAALASWLMASNAVAAEREKHTVVLTTRLYHETARLIQLSRASHLTFERFDDLDALIERMQDASLSRILVLLDSTYSGGQPQDVDRVLRDADPDRVAGVAWDNSPLPIEARPGDGVAPFRPTVPLVVIRSHSKLDQLGLELCPLGSVAIMRPTAPARSRSDYASLLCQRLSRVMGVTGAFASAGRLRLLTRMGLPEPVLTERANRFVRLANTVGGSVFRSRLNDGRRFHVACFPHACFVNVHLLGQSPERIEHFRSAFAKIETSAAGHGLPVWTSASFAFHYTALTAYPDPEIRDTVPGPPHTVLRVAFGGHEPPIAQTVAGIVADALSCHW